MIDIIYDSFSLQSNGVTTSSIGAYNTPPRDLQIESLAGADGGILVESRWRSATIPASGTLNASSQLELETLIQTFKRSLNKEAKELKVTDSNDFATWIATPGAITIERTRGLTKANWSVDFSCPNPFSTAGAGITLLSTTATTATITSSITVSGSYRAEPLMVVTLNSFTGAGDQTISLQNGKTFAGITITRTWVAGDEIEIDSLNLSVKVNGIESDFTGLFPTWEPGQGVVYYNDSLTTRDADILVTYTKRNL